MIFRKIKFFFSRLKLRNFAKWQEKNPIKSLSFKDEVLNAFKK